MALWGSGVRIPSAPPNLSDKLFNPLKSVSRSLVSSGAFIRRDEVTHKQFTLRLDNFSLTTRANVTLSWLIRSQVLTAAGRPPPKRRFMHRYVCAPPNI